MMRYEDKEKNRGATKGIYRNKRKASQNTQHKREATTFPEGSIRNQTTTAYAFVSN
jgi:hypothetical protein